MTEHHNSNADDERAAQTPGDAQNNAQNHGQADGRGDGDLDAAWAAFEAEHRDDLKDVASSSASRHFEKHAQRKEKEALLHVSDLKADAFTGTGPASMGGIGGRSRGPRDFTGSSWLDTDDVMDQYGDDFTPPNPAIGPVNKTKLVFWIMLVAGVAGVIASVFVPALTGLLGTVFGLAALIGGAGLLLRHKGHAETRTDPFDDGARV